MKHPGGKLDVPVAVREIAQRLEGRGYETWAVGGAVRDALLGEARLDWDLATAARPEIVRKLFRPSYPIGVQFGTVGVRGQDGRVYEVTTFRRDLETDGRHAVVEYADSVDEDLARRDFTINAIAYHPLRHTFHDPCAGWQDLEQRTLRCVGEPQLRFAEDYLRVLRGLRFAGRYSLRVEPSTWEALCAAVPKLSRLSGERVREEIVKVLKSASPSVALALYRESGALGEILPELAGADPSSWDELLRTIDALGSDREALRLAVLLTPASPEIEDLMIRLRFSNAELRKTRALSLALRRSLPDAGDTIAARNWLREVSAELARDALRLEIARTRARNVTPAEYSTTAARIRTVLGVVRRGDPVGLGDLAIDGNDLRELGLQPGPEFRQLLEECLDAVIRTPELNRRDRLLDHVRRLVEDKDLGRTD